MSDWNQRWLASVERNLQRAEDRKVICSAQGSEQQYTDEIYLIALLKVERVDRLKMIAAAKKEAA